jgi:sortase A
MPRTRLWVAAGGTVLLVSLVTFAGWRLLLLQQTAQEAREHLTAARAALSEAVVSPTAETGAASVGGSQLVSACAEAAAASTALEDVHTQLDTVMPLVSALEIVPGVGAQARSQTATLEAGTQVAAAGASLCDGLAPLAALLSGDSAGAGTEAANDVLRTLVAARPKLVGASERLQQLQDVLADFQLDDLESSNRTALNALRQRLPQAITTLREGTVLLDLVGAQRTRRYLLVSQNPDELRATGGFIGSAGVVEASAGSIRLVEYGSSRRYDTPADRRAVPPTEFRHYLGSSSWNLAGANWWASFPDVARQLAYFYSLSRPDEPLDGVIALDQFGLERLLEVLGPVQVPEFGETVDASEVQSKLDRYVHADASDESVRKQFTAALSTAVLQAVLEAPRSALPGLVKAVRTSLDQQHLLVWIPDPEAAVLFARKHWDGGLLSAAGDSLLLVDTDVVASKQSQAVIRDADYVLNLTEPTTPTASLTITYTNGSRPDQRPDVNFVPEYRTFLRAVVPSGSSLVSSSGFVGPITSDQECGRRVFGGEVAIPQGARVQVSLAYQLPPSIGADGYDLVVQQQPGVPPGQLAISIRTADGSATRADLANSPGAHAHWRLSPAEMPSLSLAPLPEEQVGGCGQALVEARRIAPPESIQVPGVHIAAPIVELGVTKDGEMEAPPTPDVVGWYRMSARPGQPGNSVMSGHVDWGHNTAVFWSLRQLVQGDEIQVRGLDGNVHTYAVEWNQVFPWQTAPVDRLVGPTEDSVLTLITCDGIYDTRSREYSERRVVRARLVD